MPSAATCCSQLATYGVDTAMSASRRRLPQLAGGHRKPRREHQNVIYRNGAADFELSPTRCSSIDFGAVRRADLHRHGALRAEPSRGATFRALERARAAGLPAIIDIDYRPYSWPSRTWPPKSCLPAPRACDIIVGNDEEFGFMAGGMDKGLALARRPGRGARASSSSTRWATRSLAISRRTGNPHRHLPRHARSSRPARAMASWPGCLLPWRTDRATAEAMLRGSASAAIVVSRARLRAADAESPRNSKPSCACHPGPKWPDRTGDIPMHIASLRQPATRPIVDAGDDPRAAQLFQHRQTEARRGL